jgi:hypothetical protein
MHKTKTFFALALGLTMLLAACGSTGSELTILNNSSADWCELHMSLSSDANWGPDLLGGRIAAGATHAEGGIEPGTYDVQLIPCDTAAFETYERYELDLSTDIELTLTDL